MSCLSCHYQAIVQTAVVCATAAAGYSTSVGTNILASASNLQCGGGIYDLSGLSASDFSTVVYSPTGGSNYTFTVRLCGNLTSTTACSGTPFASICQANLNTPNNGNTLAAYNPLVSAVVWTYNGNGMSQIIQDGAGCAAAAQNRFTNVTFVCSQSTTTPVVLSEREAPTSDLTASAPHYTAR